MKGHAVHGPLIERDDFLGAFANRGRLLHHRDGLGLVVDLGRKASAASFERGDSYRLMAPVRGATTVRVRVGGRPSGTTVLDVAAFTSRLKLDS